jgi:hypothetical protein
VNFVAVNLDFPEDTIGESSTEARKAQKLWRNAAEIVLLILDKPQPRG